MTAYEDIAFEVADRTVRITLNRAGKLNAFRDQTADELCDAVGRAAKEDGARSILLTGAGRAFGAGYDLTTVSADVVPALDGVLEHHFNPLIKAMRASPLPIVAAVNGPCAGAAVGIALAADIVIAGRSAFFYEPFVGIALVPDAGNTLFLSRMLGRVRASGMMLLGDRISAQQALQWGLVWEVVEDGDLQAAAQAVCDRLGGLDPAAVAGTKRLIAAAADAGLDGQLDLERDLQGEAGRSPAMAEKVAAFLAARGGAR